MDNLTKKQLINSMYGIFASDKSEILSHNADYSCNHYAKMMYESIKSTLFGGIELQDAIECLKEKYPEKFI